jgi:hypothetical protein
VVAAIRGNCGDLLLDAARIHEQMADADQGRDLPGVGQLALRQQGRYDRDGQGAGPEDLAGDRAEGGGVHPAREGHGRLPIAPD